MNVLICGLFGVGNFGDELFSFIISDEIMKDRKNTIYISTHNPHKTRLNVKVPFSYFPAFSYYSPNIFRNINTMRKIDYTLIGGGGLFNQVFFFQTIPNYAAPALLALLFNKQYAMHGIEVGSIKSPFLKKLTQFVFDHASFVMYRDQKSFDTTGAGLPEHFLGVDLSHSYFNAYFKYHTIQTIPGLLVMNLQTAFTFNREVLESLLKTLIHRVTAIKMLVVTQGEKKYAEEFLKSFEWLDQSIITIICSEIIEENMAELAAAEILITEKFHFTIAGLHSGKEQYVFAISSKVKYLLKECISHTTGVVEKTNDIIYRINPAPERQLYTDALAAQAKQYFAALPQLFSSGKKIKTAVKAKALLLFIQSMVLSVYHKIAHPGKYKTDLEQL